MEQIVKGKAWVGGDDIFAFDIIPEKRWTLDNQDPGDLGRWALERVDPEFTDKENAFKNSGYSIIVVGKNFGGGGKSIEHPVLALIGAGVKVVLADSFSRYNFRNSINNGLPVIECQGISREVAKGDELIVDLKKGEVLNTRTGLVREFTPLSDFVTSLLDAGGLLKFTKACLKK
jgi:3-isopropylmalate/(R)-2-methylmalate dehydratase small subunit